MFFNAIDEQCDKYIKYDIFARIRKQYVSAYVLLPGKSVLDPLLLGKIQNYAFIFKNCQNNEY